MKRKPPAPGLREIRRYCKALKALNGADADLTIPDLRMTSEAAKAATTYLGRLDVRSSAAAIGECVRILGYVEHLRADLETTDEFSDIDD